MITQDQIGPKLQPIDHSYDENQFLETKKGCWVLLFFDDVIDHPTNTSKRGRKIEFFSKIPNPQTTKCLFIGYGSKDKRNEKPFGSSFARRKRS